jgi:hypothetical protein
MIEGSGPSVNLYVLTKRKGAGHKTEDIKGDNAQE